MHSIVRHRDELHPTYPLTVHFKWMVDLVTMSMGVGQMRYFVLDREDLTNQVECRALYRYMQTNAISMKQVDAPESSKTWEFIEIDPKLRLTCNVKPPTGVTDLLEHREVER